MILPTPGTVEIHSTLTQPTFDLLADYAHAHRIGVSESLERIIRAFAEYESATNWTSSCTQCGGTLNRAFQAESRRDLVEAKAREIPHQISAAILAACSSHEPEEDCAFSLCAQIALSVGARVMEA